MFPYPPHGPMPADGPKVIPAATVVIFRNAPDGGAPQLLMVQRAKEMRFAGGARGPGGWRTHTGPPSLQQARPAIAAHLLGAARRRAFRTWLDARRAALVELAPGFEHPGDPRQPDNVHRH